MDNTVTSLGFRQLPKDCILIVANGKWRSWVWGELRRMKREDVEVVILRDIDRRIPGAIRPIRIHKVAEPHMSVEQLGLVRGVNAAERLEAAAAKVGKRA